MNTISVRLVIVDLYNQILHPLHGILNHRITAQNPDIGMYWMVNVAQRNSGFEKDGNTYHEDWEASYFSQVHVIITARHRVYVAKTQTRTRRDQIPIDAWKNMANHPSEWPSGLMVIDEEVNNAWHHCFASDTNMPAEHRPISRYLPPVSLGLGEFGQSRNMLQFVRVEREAIPGNEGGHLDRLTNIEPIEFSIQLDL